VAARADKTRVLIADDARVMRMLVRHWLERLGYEVVEAKDGLQALSLARTGNYDIVFLDINMPGMTGLGVLESIRQDPKLAGLPVVLVTTLGHATDVERGKDLGASAYLTKPLSYGALTVTLQRLLQAA
jgi:two-component system chemotaxis sensor kinase CheA